MDFKGITWIGNVYQKFETMCLEVEEIIVQDTVKYVEDQVQTVGASVKKFYSDVVRDMNPKSSVDSAKLLPTSMLHEYAPVCSLEKKRESTDGEATKVQREQLTKDDTWDIRDQGRTDGYAPKFHGLMGDYYPYPSPRQYKDDRTYKRTKLGAKRISRKEKPSIDTRPCVEKDSSLSTACVPENNDLESSCGKEPITSNDSPSAAARISSTEESSRKNVNGSEFGRRAVESIGNQDSEIKQPVSTCTTAGSNDCVKEADEDSSDENCVSVPQQKIIQPLAGRPLEESCILVDSHEVDCIVPQKNKNGKHKPYKMIRDAISSRMSSARKQEYKRLAHQWYAEDTVDNPKRFGAEENRSSVHQTSDSDWELLSV